MPTYKNPFEKGRLIITFHVNFPETLEKIPAIEKILPARKEVIVPDDVEEHELEEFDPEEERMRQEAYNEDSDEELGHGGQRVQCASH